MLIDRIVHKLSNNLDRVRNPATLRRLAASLPSYVDPDDVTRATVNMRDRLTTAQRFVLSPLVVQTCNELNQYAVLAKSADHIMLPAYLTYIEFEGHADGFDPSVGRHGVFMNGDPKLDHGGLVCGTGNYFRENQDYFDGTAFGFDFPAARFGYLEPKTAEERRLAMKMEQEQGSSRSKIDIAKIGGFIAAALCLINTPRISTITYPDNERLNKARAKNGKPPILSHGIVHLNLDREHLDPDQRDEREQAGTTGGRALHHVRTHLRIRLGKVEIVKPHWRGSPENGVRMRRHVVRREEDEPGAWVGGPPEPSRILRELMDPAEE